jgi:hypothetical protein
MINLIGNILKYSLLVLVIIILSHIIEIKGVTVSQHVLNGMHSVSGYDPKSQAERLTSDITKTMQKHVDDINKAGSDVAPADQKALNQVIENSEKQRRK